MRVLTLGDPHVQISNLAESEKLMQFLLDLARLYSVQRIEILGDFFHNHSNVRVEILEFWDKWFGILNEEFETIAIRGNHDMISHDSKSHALSVFNSKYNDRLMVVSAPILLRTHGYIPYIHDIEQFIKAENELVEAGAKVIVCHQTIEGSKYESGIYAPDGVPLNRLKAPTIISGHVHCYSDDTEFLTENGWKFYDNINDDEKLVTFNTQKEILEICPIISRVYRNVKEDLISIESTNLDLLLTEDHDVLLRRIDYKRNLRPYEKYKAGDMPGGLCKIPVSSKMDRIGINITDDEIRLIVWLLADGALEYKGASRSSIRWHLKKERKITRLSELLNKMNIQYSHYKQKGGTTKIRMSVYDIGVNVNEKK